MRDVRHAFRILSKSPGFTAVLLLTLALGIGADTAVFSIVDGVLLRPLPYHDPGRLIDILDTSVHESQLARIFASYDDYQEFSRHARTLERIGATSWAGRPGAVLTGRGPTKSYLALPVTDGFFATLGVPAKLGRTFTGADLAGGCAVVLSDKFWRGALHADPAIVGQSLTLDERACAVLGVMPPAFAFYPPQTDIWSLLLPDDPRLKTYFGVFMVARLKPGVTIAEAHAELSALHTALQANATNGESGFTPLVGQLQDQFNWLAGRNLSSTLVLLSAAVLLVLAIACLNVTNLLVMRSAARGREFAIRAALGSGRGRLLCQLLAEALLLTLAGDALGVLVAFGAVRYFLRAQPIELPVGATVAINLPALGFAAAISAVALVFFAVVPAWTASKADVFEALRTGGRLDTPRTQRLSRFLVAAEMALSVVLLAGASLLMRSVVNFGSAPLGFAVDNVTIASGTLPPARFPSDTRKVQFFDQLHERLDRLPGIRSAALASSFPPYGLGLSSLDVQGRPIPEERRLHDVGRAAVDSAYFSVMEVPVRRGRAIDRRDLPQSEHVAVVNDALAREYFPEEDPLGRHIRVGSDRDWLTIVGVVGNELRPEVFQEMSWIASPAVYVPLAQSPPNYFAIAVRPAGRGTGVAHLLETTLASIDSQAAVGTAETMRSRLALNWKYPEFRAAVLSAFALSAILLAAVGLYGVLAQFVSQRTREIGIRMAVGADTRKITVLVAWKGGLPFLAGLAVGMVASLALTRYLSSLLYGVTPTDPLAFAVVFATMLAAAALAMVFPARRALRVDPVVALRSE